MKPAQIRFPDWRSHVRCETRLWPNFLSFGFSLPSLTGSCIHKMKVSTCADHLITMIQELIMVGAFCTWNISFKHLPVVLSFCHDYRLCLLQRNYLFQWNERVTFAVLKSVHTIYNFKTEHGSILGSYGLCWSITWTTHKIGLGMHIYSKVSKTLHTYDFPNLNRKHDMSVP